MRINRMLLAGLLVATSSCADVVAVREPAGVAIRPRPNESKSDPTAEWPVKIHQTNVLLFLDPFLYQIHTSMTFDGQHSSIGGSANVTDDRGFGVFTFAPRVEHEPLLDFLNNSRLENFPVPIQRSCGTHLQADMRFEVWMQVAWLGGTVRPDEDSRTITKAMAQEPCPTVDREEDYSPGGGGGGGSGALSEPDVDNHPYTKCVVRYTYDLETGEILSSRLLYCY